MKIAFNIAAILIILGVSFGCKKERCFECQMFVNGFEETDEECGKDLTYSEAYLIILQRHPGTIDWINCLEQ